MKVDQLHPRIQAVEPETGLLTRAFYRWLNQVYEKLGGPDDFIQETQIFGATEDSYVIDSYTIQNQKDLNDLFIDIETRSTSRELEKKVDFDKRYCLMISS